MSYIFFAWVASIVYGLEVVIGKFTSNHTVTNPWQFNFVWSFIVLLIILPFGILNHAALPQWTINFFLTGLTYAAANILYILSLQMMDVTAMGPLFHFRTIFSVILGVFLLGEIITPFQILMIGIIFIAGVVVSIDETLKWRSFFQPGIAVMMAFLYVLALMGIFTNKTIAESGYWSTTVWSMVFAQLLYFLTLPLFWKELRTTPITKYTGLLYMSFASAGGTLAANQAYASNVGITSTIMSLPFSMIFTIIISAIRPKLLEHHTAKVYAVRVISALVMLLAALQLA